MVSGGGGGGGPIILLWAQLVVIRASAITAKGILILRFIRPSFKVTRFFSPGLCCSCDLKAWARLMNGCLLHRLIVLQPDRRFLEVSSNICREVLRPLCVALAAFVGEPSQGVAVDFFREITQPLHSPALLAIILPFGEARRAVGVEGAKAKKHGQ